MYRTYEVSEITRLRFCGSQVSGVKRRLRGGREQ